ncbi:unnamed protein product [Gadus morhua 'NCC']
MVDLACPHPERVSDNGPPGPQRRPGVVASDAGRGSAAHGLITVIITASHSAEEVAAEPNLFHGYCSCRHTDGGSAAAVCLDPKEGKAMDRSQDA